jgi:hypothetical protein
MLVGSLARTKIPMMPAPIPARSAVESANRRRASACRYPWCRLSLSDFGIYLSVGDGAAQCASRRVGQFRFRYSLPVVFATALRRPKSVKARPAWQGPSTWGRSEYTSFFTERLFTKAELSDQTA